MEAWVGWSEQASLRPWPAPPVGKSTQKDWAVDGLLPLRSYVHKRTHSLPSSSPLCPVTAGRPTGVHALSRCTEWARRHR